MDVLDDILSSLRLRGGVVVDGEFSGDFCVAAEFTPGHFEPFFPVPDKLISYHYVRSGKLVVEVDGTAPVMLEAGSVAIIPRNHPHRLASRAGLPPTDANKISQITADGVHRVSTGTDGAKAEVWCGFLEAANTSDHPLLDALPPLLTLKIVGGEAEWLDTSMRFLSEQQPSSEVVAKLAELFLTQAVREYVDHLPFGASGWLRGLTDPAVTKALSIIHSRFAEDLDVEGLAREAGVSRTVLGEKFAELIGEPPMRYCARWRMRMAANMLRDGKQNASNVAYSVGFNSEAAFTRAFKREYGVPPATWRRQFEEEAKSRDEAQRIGLPKQLVRHAMARDGTRLAYSVMGKGPPLVKAANWLNHLEHDWKSPVWRHWLNEFTRGHTLIRYDERANGLSDWDTPEISFDAFVDDLECVVETTGLESFDLLAISQGAAVAIAYAVRHPEKVRRLLILGGYSAGWAARGDPGEIARREALLKLTEVGWGSDHPTYRQVFTSLYIPEGTPEQVNWWNEMQRVSCSPENAVKLQRALSLIDVRDLLPKVTVPTLIFHSRDDQVVPFTAGEYLAEHIPGATFVPLEGENHVLLEKEPAWTAFTRLARRFLKPEASSAAAAHSDEALRVPALVRPGIRHCTGADGTRLAFAISGDDGPPLIKVPNWFNHLEEDWGSPVWCDWIEWMSKGRRLLRYDGRGHGASDRTPARISPEGFVEDLATVADASHWDTFDLLGIGHGATMALAFAAKFPERVRKLVVLGAWAVGWRRREDQQDIARRQAIVDLSGIGWEQATPLYREIYTKLYAPDATLEQVNWLNEVQRKAATAEHAVAFQNAMGDIDIRDDLKRIKTPLLALHALRDHAVPLSCGEEVARGLRVHLIRLNSDNHILLPQEHEWTRFTRLVDDFLRAD